MARSPASHPYREFEFAGWQQAARAYAETFEAATRLYAEPLLDAVSPQPGEILLDNACGTGSVAAAAVERGATVVGADFSPAMLAAAKRLHPMIQFDCADAEALPYPGGTFHCVVVNFGCTIFRSPSALFLRYSGYCVTAGERPARCGRRRTGMRCRPSFLMRRVWPVTLGHRFLLLRMAD